MNNVIFLAGDQRKYAIVALKNDFLFLTASPYKKEDDWRKSIDKLVKKIKANPDFLKEQFLYKEYVKFMMDFDVEVFPGDKLNYLRIYTNYFNPTVQFCEYHYNDEYFNMPETQELIKSRPHIKVFSRFKNYHGGIIRCSKGDEDLIRKEK